MTLNFQKPNYKPAIAPVMVLCEHCNQTQLMARLSWTRIPFFNWLFAYYGCSVCGSKSIIPVEVEPVSPIDKTAVLKMLHDQFNQEITRYRDYEWKIVLWSLALSWGVFLASSLYIHPIPDPDLRLLSDLLLIGSVILGTLLLATHLLFIHGELTTNRNWREKTRRLLGVYRQPTPFPFAWNSYLYQFKSGRDDFVIPFLLLMMLSGLGVSYLIAYQHKLPEVVPAIWSTAAAGFMWGIPCLMLGFFLIGVGYVVAAIIRQGQRNLMR